MAGYSGTPLAKKLGIKESFRVKTKRVPEDYLALIQPLPKSVTVSSRLRAPVDLYHLFVKSRDQLQKDLPKAINEIQQNGAIWVSWPKKSSGVRTDVTEDVIREIALQTVLVDVKVCAVDETWSGLKLVIRKEHRAQGQ